MPREWNAGEYQRLSNPQLSWGLKVLARAPIRGDETVLDAGCGTGRVTAELLERLPRGRVVGVDLSRNMLRQAHGNLRNGRTALANADLLALPFSAASFNGVFSTATFHWVLDHDRLFSEIFRVLKPGGWLAAQCGGGPNLSRLRKRARTLLRSARFSPFFEGWREPWHYATAEETAARLRNIGFVGIDTGLEPAPTTLGNAREFRDFQATVTLHPYLAPMTDQRARDEFLDELTALAAKDDPPYTLDYWRLNISARKP